MAYFKKALEKASGYQYKTDLESKNAWSQIRYLCEENICEAIKSKLNSILNSYEDKQWAPSALAYHKSEAIEDTLNYLNVSEVWINF